MNKKLLDKMYLLKYELINQIEVNERGRKEPLEAAFANITIARLDTELRCLKKQLLDIDEIIFLYIS